MKIRTGHILLVALLAASGCYSFRPASVESLPAGSLIRAELSPAGAQEVMALTGAAKSRIEGSVVRAARDTLVLEVWRTDIRSDRAFSPGRVQLPLHKQNVLEITEKRLSYARTGAVSAVLAFGLYQLYQTLSDGAGGTSDGTGGTGGGPTIIRCC